MVLRDNFSLYNKTAIKITNKGNESAIALTMAGFPIVKACSNSIHWTSTHSARHQVVRRFLDVTHLSFGLSVKCVTNAINNTRIRLRIGIGALMVKEIFNNSPYAAN